MRKFISFLALLVIAFALPGKALAWNGYGLDGSDGSWIDLTWDNSDKCLKGTIENKKDWKFKVQAYDNSKVWFGFGSGEYVVSGNLHEVDITSNNGQYLVMGNADKYDVIVYTEGNNQGWNPVKIVLSNASTTTPDPEPVDGLNYNTNVNPKNIVLNLGNGSWANQIMKFNDAGYWYHDFKAAGTQINFTVIVDGNNYYAPVTVGFNTWSDAQNNPVAGGNFGVTGLTKDKYYRFELKGAANDPSQFIFRVVEAEEPAPVPVVVNLPLTSRDFANGKKHYFIVGERMSEWRLQPEWELTVSGDQAVINNRFLYDGSFAIAVVDNYNDYIKHAYKAYAREYTFKSDVNTCPDGIGLIDVKVEKGKTTYRPKGAFWSGYDANYYQGKGQFVSQIAVTLADGVPSAVTITTGTAAQASQNRVFTLVGNNIYNDNYCNVKGTGNTTLFDRSQTTDNGWQEGWIQYDPTDNKPYVDGNGEYLYLTSFTPDWMGAYPVQFNQALSGDDNFSFTSKEAQFIEASKLSNLNSDPYKDLYKAFGGNENIVDGVKKAGADYNFTVATVNDAAAGTTPAQGEWNCYVVRDMWVAGQIKFWTGWGGNSVDTQNNKGDQGAAWFGPNGGPAIAIGGRQDVKGSDVTTGTVSNLYKNGANIDNANYVISADDKPVYFNRVLLWYSEQDGIGTSYIQFVQESAGPAIFARATDNTAGTKKNFIRYNWYLNASQNETDADKKVVSYSIRRYRVVDGVQTFIGYPEGESVDISDMNVTVADLLEENAGKLDFTKFTDSGTVAGRGFSPGLYQYDIYVTFEDGVAKKAVSNIVAIYDDSLVNPDAYPMQVVELRDAYTDLGGDHDSGKAFFNTDKKYLTYSDADNASFYLFNTKEVEVEGVEDADKTVIPVDIEKVDAAKAIEFLTKHQDKFLWTSDYYLRCLDYNAYLNLMQEYVDGGLLAEVPVPVLAVNEIVELTDADGAVTTETKPRGYAAHIRVEDNDGNADNDKEYYSLIVRRAGNLADGTFDVALSYTYKDTEGNDVTPETSAGASFDPAIPRPYNPLYRYLYKHDNTDEFVDAPEWGKIMVPAGNWENGTTSDFVNNGKTKDVYVKLDSVFNPRELILQVDFNRPNVTEEIYKYYDIHYDINIFNNDKDVPLDIDAILHDTAAMDSVATGVPNRYRIEISGIHPRNSVYPIIKFRDAIYEPNKAADDASQWTYKPQKANYGNRLEIVAGNHIQVNDNPQGLTNVHLGVIKRADGTYDWMYKGHEDFQDNQESMDPVEDNKFPYEDTTTETIKMTPYYYLVELKNSTDSYTYDYLVPHKSGHREGELAVDPVNGLILNDSDPLIGTYIAKGFTTDEAPEVFATAIYVFRRNLDGESTDNSNVDFTTLEVLSYVNNAAKNDTEATPASAPARIKEGVTNNDLMNGNAGDMPDAGVLPEKYLDLSAPAAGTGYNAFIATKASTYSDAPGNNGTVTGVEGITLDGVDGQVIYYTLQGIRLMEEPATAGVYFRVEGKNVTKFIVQ